MVGRFTLVLGCFAVLLFGCRSAEFVDDLRVVVQPRVLDDDGDRARVVISTNDAYGEPGKGRVRVQSTAGSLVDGLELVLGKDGTVETELSCEVKKDPACFDTVTVWAEWSDPQPPLKKSFAVTIHTTDAFVSACGFMNRRVLKMLTGDPPAVQLAVLDTQPEVARTALGAATWDATSGVGAIAQFITAPGSSVTEDETLLRQRIGDTGTVENPLVQTFTTWDGMPAVRSTFDLIALGDLKNQLNALSLAIGGAGSGLTGAAGKTGPFKAELEVVRFPKGQNGVVLALTSAATFSEAASFDLDDVAGGSALSSAEDAPVDHCEIFTVAVGKKVDFFWVVDDSCSMGASQTAVATVGSQAAQRIAAAQLDFRSGGVSTGWYPPAFNGSRRAFTNNMTTMLSWFSGINAWGTDGTGDERGFQALDSYLTAREGGTEFRSDSEVHVVFLSDTRDQSPLSVADMKQSLARHFPKQRVIVSGILCPEGQSCGDASEMAVGKYHTLIRETGGVLGSINVFNPPMVTPQLQRQQADTMNKIVGTVINGAGYQLQYKPITASVRVAASATADPTCNNRDIPRSNTNGWDLDPLTGRIAFYGKCVPQLGGTMVVSYKSWARFGTRIHHTTTPVYAVRAPEIDAGTDGGASADAGLPDAGEADAGAPDAGP